VLQYAHEHGCPWDIFTSCGAAEGGHLEVMRYAHGHGCPWDAHCLAWAEAAGHSEVAEYLRAAAELQV